MDFVTQQTIWSFYSSLAGSLSAVYMWCLLGLTFFYHVTKKPLLMWLCLLVFINQLLNHLSADYLLSHYFLWNVAWIMSDCLLVFTVYFKVKKLGTVTKQDLSVMILALVDASLNLLRYIERLADYHDSALFFSVKNFYGVGINTVNLVTLMILSYPALKFIGTTLKEYFNGVATTLSRNVKHSGNGSSN